MARHFRRRQTLGMASEQHSDTKVHTIGPGTALIPEHIVRDTEVGPRDPDASVDTIQLGRGSSEECNIGDVCKYINLFIQGAPRIQSGLQATGWIEYAFVIAKAGFPLLTKTNIGTRTLGDLATTYYRDQCVWTGNLPIGNLQANSVALMIKVPRKFQKLEWGYQWKLLLIARTSDATETGTGTFRVLTSAIYRNYH